ncbi:DUF7718 family protein [Halobiforma nitratireducens]|uniref:Uncharacterized protein n=1 Tax=Halobiforma nitratireducens JCM 10879 TaxID=1227454 RepID=M0MAL6_9EURY|nr:hypothetical protein [Halobiforma nitratireducens]EMA41664.1 hypothetical protein C446_05095 [Halobiforma nitratireducens JCM 10879]
MVPILAGTGRGHVTEWLSPGAIESAVVTAIVVLVGGLILTAESERGRRVTDRVRYNLFETALYGVGITVTVVLVVLVLVLLRLGILALPLLIGYLVALVPATVVGYLVVGRLVSGNWLIVVAVGTVAAAIAATIPYLGIVVGFTATSIGLGSLVLEYVRTHDREFTSELVDPAAMKARIGVSSDEGAVTRFRISITYWTGTSHETVVRYVHDPTEDGADVTEDGLRMWVHGNAGSIDVETLTEPTTPHDALWQAFEHLETNLDELVREFEREHGIDGEDAEWDHEEPLEAAQLQAARETLREQREETDAYLSAVSDGLQAGWVLDVSR